MISGTVIVIENWDAFQHYKDRDPPWVKLYRDLLTAESWVLGTDCSRLVQLAIILLAARYQNATPNNFTLLRKVASLDCSESEFNLAIAHLQSHKFLIVKQIEARPEDSASTMLATCSPETEQSREETENMSASPRKRSVPRETDPAELLEFKLAYPFRAGAQAWRGAIAAANARIREGHSWAEMIAGAKRYAAYCEATGSTGTQYVKTAKAFLGPEKHFLEPWTKPPERKPPSKLDDDHAARMRLVESMAARGAA